MARFCSLFSSSSGNSTYFGSSGSGILIDAGVSATRLRKALQARDIAPSGIAAVFITHPHTDHISGLRLFACKGSIPVYATAGTLDELERAGHLCRELQANVIPDGGLEIGGMFVRPFAVSHDTAAPCGYTVSFPDERKAAVCTDTGHITPEIGAALRGADLVLLESNHDIGMLENGPYPYSLKRRILSERGHLSNDACAAQAVTLVQNGTTRLFLGHLSPKNNIPALAYETTHAALTMGGAVENRDYTLSVSKRENDEGLVVF